MNDLISIIIPIYNAEEYLDKCLESIAGQTYKNLEVILIDDESSDNSPRLCDEWAKKDKRFKVIHKKNGGVASSRNEGLKNANGSIIGFVDSDDYIEKDYYERLYNNLISNNADIAMCTYNDEYIDGQKKLGKHFDKFTILNGKDAIKNLILEENISNHLWNKVYKKELFNGITFPYGKKMEDLSVMYLLFEKADKIVYENYIGYHYLQHKESIMGSVNRGLIDNYEESVFARNNYLLNKYPEFEYTINIDNIKTYKLLHYLSYVCNEKELLNSNKYKEYYKLYKKNYFKYRKGLKENVGSKSIISYDFFWISKFLYSLLIKKQ